jgi:dihydrolipoamide dehydrogenase
MIAEMALAMRGEMTVKDIASTVHPHPTISESVQEAFYAALGAAIHF